MRRDQRMQPFVTALLLNQKPCNFYRKTSQYPSKLKSIQIPLPRNQWRSEAESLRCWEGNGVWAVRKKYQGEDSSETDCSVYRPPSLLKRTLKSKCLVICLHFSQRGLVGVIDFQTQWGKPVEVLWLFALMLALSLRHSFHFFLHALLG